MNFSRYSFPHPILGRSDDIAGDARIENLTVVDDLNSEEFIVNLDFVLQNHKIEELMANGFVNFYCEVSCSATLYRKVSTSPTPNLSFRLSKNCLRGRVELLFLAVTTQPISSYTNPDAHPELQDMEADLERGDVLAYFGDSSFPADVAFQKLKAASTFMELVKGEREVGPFEVVLDNPKILVRLSKKDYEIYTRSSIGGNAGLSSTFQSAIAFPALLFGLQQLSSPEGNSQFGETSWAKAITWRIENEELLAGMSLDPENAIEIAQRLLGSPAERLLTDLDSASHLEDEQD